MEGKTEGNGKVSGHELTQRMIEEFRKSMAEVAEAVTKAPDGAWINASEHQVRDVMVALQRKAFQTAIQMKVEAAQAAFSPSEGRGDGPKATQQGTAKRAGADDQ